VKELARGKKKLLPESWAEKRRKGARGFNLGKEKDTRARGEMRHWDSGKIFT